MSDLAIAIKPPFKHHGPSSPEFLAKQREQALMIKETKTDSNAANVSSSLNHSDAKIARGGDPKEILGLEPDRIEGEQDINVATGPMTPKELVLQEASAENIFAAMAAEANPAEGSRDLELIAAKEEAFVAHKQALKSYAEAALVFQEALTEGRDTYEPLMN